MNELNKTEVYGIQIGYMRENPVTPNDFSVSTHGDFFLYEEGWTYDDALTALYVLQDLAENGFNPEELGLPALPGGNHTDLEELCILDDTTVLTKEEAEERALTFLVPIPDPLQNLQGTELQAKGPHC